MVRGGRGGEGGKKGLKRVFLGGGPGILSLEGYPPEGSRVKIRVHQNGTPNGTPVLVHF